MVVPDLTNTDPLINRTIEGYHFIKRLGEGSYGLVYLARHPRIKERLVAVKYLKLGNPKETRTVEREVEILARLQHPNIVDIYDTYRFEHYQLIVMELIRGGNLQDALNKIGGLLDLRDALEMIENLAFALGYVHNANILHLDLKPANILLDPVSEGQMARFVLTDFGIAQIVNPDSLRSTSVVGTPKYMSPEHFGFGNNKPDNRSDIYSLGVILYQLITGHVPFQSPQLLEILNQHAYTPAPAPSQDTHGIPPALDQIVLKALAKNPAERFQSANEMGSALRELRFGVMSSLQPDPRRASIAALGEIAQANGEIMTMLDEQYPPPVTTRFNLVIMKPDGTQEHTGFEKTSVIVGREQGVDLLLDQHTVSRRHARIDCDKNGNLFITDLQSANGTYLDGVRLSPQERILWTINQFVQIRGFLLQIGDLAGSQPEEESEVFTSDQVLHLLNEVQNRRSKPLVHTQLSPAIIYIEPGKPQYVQVQVAPENTPLARYELRAKPGPGLSERWYTLPAGQVIRPNETYTFDFIVSAPPIGTIGGEIHEIALEIVTDQPEIPSSIQILKMRVVAMTRFTAALRPSEVSHHRRRRAELTVSNHGNQRETFTFEVQAPDVLRIIPESPQIEVPPGEEQVVRLKFKPTRDAQQNRSRLVYSVAVHAASGITERCNGTYIFRKRRRLPVGQMLVWAIIVIVAARWILYGVSLPQQVAEVRALIDGLIQWIGG
ncbi:MAG: protein kinase [Anaerolineaceae bacterium]|nr:protein kinase [Anaerolineaceae bacterium]